MNEMSGGVVWCVVVSTSSYVRSAGGGRTDHQDAARGDKIDRNIGIPT